MVQTLKSPGILSVEESECYHSWCDIKTNPKDVGMLAKLRLVGKIVNASSAPQMPRRRRNYWWWSNWVWLVLPPRVAVCLIMMLASLSFSARTVVVSSSRWWMARLAKLSWSFWCATNITDLLNNQGQSTFLRCFMSFPSPKIRTASLGCLRWLVLTYIFGLTLT